MKSNVIRLLAAMAICVSLVAGLVSYENHGETLFVHSVYFWLKEDVSDANRNEFVQLLKSLEQIASVEALEIGVPAGTPREVVDNTYDVALLVYFEDQIGHDKYQSDTIHVDAIAQFEDWIERVQIYDVITTK